MTLTHQRTATVERQRQQIAQLLSTNAVLRSYNNALLQSLSAASILLLGEEKRRKKTKTYASLTVHSWRAVLSIIAGLILARIGMLLPLSSLLSELSERPGFGAVMSIIGQVGALRLGSKCRHDAQQQGSSALGICVVSAAVSFTPITAARVRSLAYSLHYYSSSLKDDHDCCRCVWFSTVFCAEDPCAFLSCSTMAVGILTMILVSDAPQLIASPLVVIAFCSFVVGDPLHARILMLMISSPRVLTACLGGGLALISLTTVLADRFMSRTYRVRPHLGAFLRCLRGASVLLLWIGLSRDGVDVVVFCVLNCLIVPAAAISNRNFFLLVGLSGLLWHQAHRGLSRTFRGCFQKHPVLLVAYEEVASLVHCAARAPPPRSRSRPR
jgi:hypothetical protein